MSIYYKIKKNSATGINIKGVLDKVDVCVKATEELKKKYNIKNHYKYDSYLCGVDAVSFECTPDKVIWKKVGQYYYPKAKVKEIIKDFDAVNDLRIRRALLDNAIIKKSVSWLFSPGLDISLKDCYIAILEKDWDIDLPEDCIRISDIEYENLERE